MARYLFAPSPAWIVKRACASLDIAFPHDWCVQSTSAGVFSAARNSEERSSKEGRVRYFVIKSFNQENIDIAVDIGGWSTTNDVAYRLDEAFHSGAEVRLFFSVNGSGTFSGYAVMKTAAGRFPGPPILWSNNKPFGQSFVIEWKCLYNLPYSAIEHLRNPLNEDKVVYHARGGQELPCSVGD
ncbi:YT521-B-like domain-containing protein, partial [Haematococcus lacustris]